MKEWFLSEELIEVNGLPNSIKLMSQHARRNNWLSRKAAGKGRALEYHISSFHPEVQDHLIAKYITNQSDEATFRDYLKNYKSDKPLSNVSKVIPMTEFKEWSELPVFNVHAAAGAGSLISAEYAIEKLMIPTSLLAEFGLSAKTSAIIYVDGDSMEPSLSHNDRLLVDVRELQHPVTNGVYVIRIDDSVYVKRLRWDIANGVYNIISDNPIYPVFQVDHNNGRNFKIIGKAVAPLFKRIL
ncbi:S24 family peptidase [Vibrio diazotrophicus]|uniref:S24 family peptidase n=1 Tax=Vibrio diazotrophicus TaxID=685 RepID=UPI000C9EC63C|nr:S24 family peptidase [Vibrio diazotrophicus]PNH95730.1 peptidase [Vibrio diazotrophicus]